MILPRYSSFQSLFLYKAEQSWLSNLRDAAGSKITVRVEGFFDNICRVKWFFVNICGRNDFSSIFAGEIMLFHLSSIDYPYAFYITLHWNEQKCRAEIFRFFRFFFSQFTKLSNKIGKKVRHFLPVWHAGPTLRNFFRFFDFFDFWTRPTGRRVLCNQLRPSVSPSVTQVLILVGTIRFSWFFASS